MVNLLPKTAWEMSFWGRFFRWALTAGRYIVILTEMVVIAAFLSRFKLDRDYADLADRITGKQAVLTSLAESEKRFRLAQGRLVEAGKILDEQLGITEVLDKITAKTPPGVTLINLAVSKKEIVVTGAADNDAGVGIFLSRLAADKSWKSVRLAGLEANEQTGVRFSLKLWLN